MNTETKKRERPRGEHRTSAANRQKILEATLQVAQEYGYQGTTIPRVSLKAQLPTGSVYWHFESKDILFASLMDQSREWLEGFHRKRRPLPGESTRKHLERIYCNAPESEALIHDSILRRSAAACSALTSPSATHRSLSRASRSPKEGSAIAAEATAAIRR